MEETGVAAFARRTPTKPALVDGQRIVGFADLNRRMNQLARALRTLGIGAGDRIALALRNRVEWFEVAGAASRAGVTVVPVSWRSMHDEVSYLVEDSGSVAVFAESDATDVMSGLPAIFLGTQYEQMLEVEDEGPLATSATRPLIGFRYYTSGTTGRPKAIEGEMPTGEELEALRRAFTPPAMPARPGGVGTRPLGRGQTEGLEGPNEIHLLVGPAYHTAPGNFASRALQYGQTVVVMSHFDAEECLRLIEQYRVTWSHMVPINFVRILKLPEAARLHYDLSSVRRILHAAAPCPVEVKRSVMKLFPAGSIYEYYGATEGLATVCPSDEWERKPGSVGRAAPGVDVRVLDDHGEPLARGEVGTVYFSPMMKFAYAGEPEKTQASWRGRFFTAGDMGYIDEDDYLFLTDRKIDMIISGGANVYPAEVEAVLIAHPAVIDVAVFGVPDPEWGERVHAVVEVGAAVQTDDILEFCRQRLAHYKCPTTVEVVERLPRDPNGKIRKRVLRAPHWTGEQREI